jgi:hypothetical protein
MRNKESLGKSRGGAGASQQALVLPTRRSTMITERNRRKRRGKRK